MDGSVVKLIAGRLDELIGQAQRKCLNRSKGTGRSKEESSSSISIDRWMDR